jgi:serine protease Do
VPAAAQPVAASVQPAKPAQVVPAPAKPEAQKPATDPYDWRNFKNESTGTNAPKKSGGSGAILIAILALIISFASVGISAWQMATQGQPKKVNKSQTTNENGYYSGNYQFEETTIAGVVERVAPAVVSIVTETRVSNSYSYYGESYAQAAGTGMIVTSDGYILTNKHVIEGARKIQVIMDSGEVYDDVEIVGKDPLNDVAYLKIKNVSDLPTVTLGDSKYLAVGEPVLAIGNALGAFQNSVTSGIISGLGRSITAADEDGNNSEELSDLIQTDAAINPGNSGGPLVNAAGEVIGINSAASTDYNNLGFSIPISATKGMLNSIMQNGKAVRAYVGIAYQNITPEIANENNLPVSSGAWISNSGRASIATGGPAEKAGLKEGDIITKIDGVEIGKAGSLSTLVSEHMAGETVEFEFIRGNDTMVTNVTLGEYK